MTILEASYVFGTKEYTTSVNDSLTSLVFKLYGSYDDIYFIVLQKLNNRSDWLCIKPNSKIKYLEKSVIGDIYEITS